jgi:hypothetical protein
VCAATLQAKSATQTATALKETALKEMTLKEIGSSKMCDAAYSIAACASAHPLLSDAELAGPANLALDDLATANGLASGAKADLLQSLGLRC